VSHPARAGRPSGAGHTRAHPVTLRRATAFIEENAHRAITIAYRWGFPSTSRFAAEYRTACGVTPSHTLRG